MTENPSRGTRDFSKYDSMRTEELEQILRQDAISPDGAESDTELLLYVMEVLAKRRNTTHTGNNAQKAWESFQQNYMPEAQAERGKTRIISPLFRRLIAASVVIVLAILIPVTAKALSLDKLWHVFAQWAKETFSFVSEGNTKHTEPSPDDNNEYSSLQALLEAHNIDPAIAPSWLPAGFSLTRIEKDITPRQIVCRASYINGDKECRIRIQSYLDSNPEKMEVNSDLIEIYLSNGIEYYIFFNNEQLRAMWMTDSYECYISGNLTIEELKQIIDSIGKG